MTYNLPNEPAFVYHFEGEKLILFALKDRYKPTSFKKEVLLFEGNETDCSKMSYSLNLFIQKGKTAAELIKLLS